MKKPNITSETYLRSPNYLKHNQGNFDLMRNAYSHNVFSAITRKTPPKTKGLPHRKVRSLQLWIVYVMMIRHLELI